MALLVPPPPPPTVALLVHACVGVLTHGACACAQVVGRAAELHRLREAAGAGKRRSSTRANKYAQHVKEAYVRELPALFRTLPAVNAAGDLSVWCHPLRIGGTATGLGILFSGECPVRELLVGSEKQRQQCVLEDGFPMTLSAVQAQLAARWLVGSLDLTQAGNSGEPLHPSLNTPQQLLQWHHITGSFSPNQIAEMPVAREVAELDSFPRTREWRDHRRDFPDEARAAAVNMLAKKVTSIVASIAQQLRAASGGMPPSPDVIVTVDLDRTLWKGECLDWPVGSFTSHSATAVFDERAERFLELHAEVLLVFAALKQAGVRVAVASASIAADSARALLSSFGLREHISDDAIEMGDDPYKRDSRKVAHLQTLSERLGVPVDRLVLFDDAQANVHKVREVLGPADAEAGCSAMCVDPAVGLTAEALLLGLEHRLAELSLRRRFTEERRREESRGDAYKERLRKVKQGHADMLAHGQAHLDDVYRLASKLEKLAVEPGWWLAVPLTPSSVDTGPLTRSSVDDAAELDWELMEHAARLFTTCAWPSLADAEHDRLVQASASVDDDELQAGPVDLCALATYATERHLHYNLLEHVSVEGGGDSLTISGDVRSRRVNVGASAAKRIVQADGSFRTQETERAVGYRPRDVQLLPMRSSHHHALKMLKRLLCRLEHLVRLTEPDVRALFGADAVVVPLERLSAALTHPGASAEAVRVSRVPPALPDRFVHDERGCCQWEELEWLGDGILRFYAVVWVLVNDQGTSVRGLSPAKEALENNLELHRRAKQHGLPALTLCNPFVTNATLPQHRKQACSIKDQADPMEALLGTVALAAMDAAPNEPALPTAIRGAFGFFYAAVLPPPKQPRLSTPPFDTAAKLMAELVTQFTRCHKDVKNDEAAAGLRAALVAQSGPIPLERVDGMLHACSLCRSGIVFERAEFFGDAFLQIAVSIELARRFPHSKNGDFTDMRSALVSNLNLGRLLIRRFGIDPTYRFVEASGSGVAHKPNQLKAIRTFISETVRAAHADEPLDTVWAIYAASKAEEEGSKTKVRAQVLAANGLVEEDAPSSGSSGDAQYYSRRGEDYRKPLGDQYEAIVGLVFCAYGGDCEATWRCFVNDFFPPSSPSSSAPEKADTEAVEKAADEDQYGKMNTALHHLRQTKAKLAVKRQMEPSSMAAAMQMVAPPTMTAPPLAADPPPSVPPLMEPEVTLVGGDDLVLEQDDYLPQAHVQSAPLTDAAPPPAAAPTAGHSAIALPAAQAAAPPALAAPVPSAAAAPQYENPIGEVNELLQRAQVPRDAFLRSEVSDGSSFGVKLFHVDSSQLLGSAAGHARKKAAEKAAYTDMLRCWEQRGIQQLLDRMRTGGMQPTLQPGEGVPSPASQPLGEQSSVEQLRLAGSKRALAADIHGLHAFASGLARKSPVAVTDEASLETVLDAVVDSVESNEQYKRKIRKLATVAGLPPSALQAVAHKAVELSRRVRPRPPEVERSAGRLFHDVLLEAVKYEPADQQPALLPRRGDLVRLFGLNAAQHNGTTGRVIPPPKKQNSDGKLAVATHAVPEGLLIKESQLQLLRLGDESLCGLRQPARQLTYYLQEAEDNEFDYGMLLAHGLELPLFFLHTYAKLRGVLDADQVPNCPHTRLAILQAAVREAPTLSLCGAYHDRVRRRCDLEEACQGNGCLLDSMEVEPLQTDSSANFDAMVLPAEPPDAEPRAIQLPLRADYLHAIIESLVSLAGGIGAPLGMHARYAGQATEQPVLYFLIAPSLGHDSLGASPRRNVRASRLAGYDIFGDAILADIELDHEHRRHPTSGGVPVCERFLAMEVADPLAFTLASAGRPLLGNWVLPRLAAWPKTRRPKAVMEEFMVRYNASTGRSFDSSAWPVRTQEDGSPEAHTPFAGAAYTNIWLLEGRDPPPDAHYNDERECHELRSVPSQRPKKDAENEAVLLMMHALSDKTPSPPWVPISEPLRIDGIAPEAACAAAAGSTVVCSYALFLENSDGIDSAGAGGPLAGSAVARGTKLEESAVGTHVVLGAGVLHPKVEEVLAEVAGEWQAPLPTTCDVRIGARYHGVDVSCLLTLTVHSVVRGKEESEYELAGGPEGLGPLRMQKLVDLLHEMRPTCLADIGCGEASLLQRVLDGNVPSTLSRLVGMDVGLRALKRGAKKLRTAHAHLVSSGAAGRVPSVQMLRGSLADVDAARLTVGHGPDALARIPPDVLTLVEVVEHLDPPELHALGPALLGRCAPRALIVTTPNKEYNLNGMARCQNEKTTECRARHQDNIDALKLQRMLARGELCKGCALFRSGQPPPFERYKLRNDDHRFEFTRSEFRDWADDLGSKFGYSVRYDGVGGGPLDEPYDKDNTFHGPGPSALVCVFERQAASALVASPMATDTTESSSSLAHLCVWDSDAMEWDSDMLF